MPTVGNDLINGTTGNDSIDALAGNDYIAGLGGNDTLDGGSGSDTLDGGDGDDVLRPGTSAGGIVDYIFGGSGNDTVDLAALGGGALGPLSVTTAGPDGFFVWGGTVSGQYGQFSQVEAIRLGASDDLFVGGSQTDDVAFGAGGDWAAAGGGNDRLLGGDGADTLDGQAGNDTLIGGDGNDVIYGEQTFVFGEDSIDLGDGDDFGWGGQNADTLIGGAGNDTLIGDPTGSNGADSLRPGAGIDFVDGGGSSGDAPLNLADTLYLDDEPGSILIVGAANGPGNTYVTASGVESFRNVEALRLGAGNDTVYVGFDPQNQHVFEVVAGAGNDFIADTIAGLVDRRFFGGDGDDTLIGSLNGADSLFGGSGNDFMNAGSGTGGDVLDGGDGRDTLIGGDGLDSLTGGAGDDVINGGGGRDTVSFQTATTSVTVNLAAGWANSAQTGLDVLIAIEAAVGGSGNDTILGGGPDGQLSGLDGDDYLATGSGGSQLFGGNGNDTLVGGTFGDFLQGDAGIDFVDGGGGLDQIGFGLETTGIQFFGAQGYVITTSGTEFFVNVEEVGGGIGADTIVLGGAVAKAFGDDGNDVISTVAASGADTFQVFGDGGDDQIYGDVGRDAFLGMEGADTIFGGDGNDSLDGGEGNDTLDGGAGNDDLAAGGGVDFLTGGIDADTFTFNDPSDSAPTLEDAIADFVSGTDKIKLSGMDANTNLAGTQSFTFIGSGGFTGTAGQLRVVAFTGPNFAVVAGDVDGDGVADFRLLVYGDVPIGSDFIL